MSGIKRRSEGLCCFLLGSFLLFLNGPPRYGAPGVELTGLHKETATVTQLHFLAGQVGGGIWGGPTESWWQPLELTH